MPPFTLTAGMKALLKQWGAIQAAAATRLGVAGAWSAVSEAGGIEPVTGVSPTIFDMNQLYGLAAGNRAAAESFANAADTAAVMPTMAGLSPNSRTAAAREISPVLHARAEYTVLRPTGTIDTQWSTFELTLYTGLTKTALLSTIETAIIGSLTTTAETPTRYKGTLAGLGTVTLVRY